MPEEPQHTPATAPATTPTPSAADGPRFGRARKWGLISLAVFVLFAMDFTGMAAEWRNSHLPWPLRYPLVWQLTGHLAFLAVLPLLLGMFERWPLRKDNLRFRLPLYLLAMCGFTGVQILLMWILRVAAYALLGWGRYEYGDPIYILPMELTRALPGYLGTLGLYSLFTALTRQREREVAAVRLERELVEARLGLLKAQLQPHFLFNALNMIRTYVYEDVAVADRMLGHLADFLRLTLRHATVQEVTLAAELQFLDAYLAIMKARFEERLIITRSVQDGLGDALIPHLVLQPLVENAIQQGLRDPGDPACIEVSAVRVGDRLVLRVADNGPGLRGGKPGGHGIGLSSTRERLRTLYGEAQRLDAGDRPGGGFMVCIELPYHAALVGGPAADPAR